MRYFKGLFGSFLKFLLVIGSIFGLLFFLGFSGIAWLFIMPMTYLDTEGVIGFFTTGTDEWNTKKDKELGDKYQELMLKDLGSKEQQMYTPSQYDQGYGFRLPWTLLAAVDRVLGDPTNNDKTNRNPQPEKHYAALKPEFTWKQATVIVKKKEVTEDGKTRWVTYTYPVSLLDRVDAYNATHQMVYRKVVTNDESIIVEKYELESVETEFLPEDENRLLTLLKSYKLPKKDQQLVIDLALNYSGDKWEETQYLLSQIGDKAPSTKPGVPENPNIPPPIVDGGWTGILPLAGKEGKDYWMSSSFGYRRDPYTGVTSYHDGLDLAAPPGTPVYAPLDGVVVHAKNMNGFGKTIMIQHGGYITLYGHLSAIQVKKGEQVTKGKLIGNVGSTGRSTGPHLHWSVYKNAFGKKNAIDPLQFIKTKQ
ncbi:peptidoglycan LD-endopeptidase LytH [Brevibacillus sp. IT-7CA2]|uniref:M23 family metallopeptidase n=1 Tax=Brevibacillus sp. IT-7CA2 TaxID=3026436 RepID=UPI0039DF2B5D